MDQVERAAEAQPAPRVQPSAEIVNSALPEPNVMSAEMEPAAVAGEEPVVGPDPEVAVTTDPERDIVNSGAPEPTGETLRGEAEPAVPTPANDTGGEIALPEPLAPEPLVKPILIGADGEPPAERKRGWWRR